MLPACKTGSATLWRHLFLIFVLLGLATQWPSGARAATNLPTSLTLGKPLSELRPFEAVVLGIVEGVTEFLPISSTGHLIAVTDFLHLDTTRVILDKTGEPLWYRRPTIAAPGELLTVKLATRSYIVVIQFGAIAAIAPICWSQLLAMGRGLLGRDRKGLQLLSNVLIAFLPAAGLGLLIHDWIDENLFSVGAVIFGLAAGSLLMFFADLWPSWLEERHAYHDELTPAGAAGIGILQCLAMWPGTSRPMMTIVGGYFAGLRPGPAAGFSFLLGFVTLTAATIYKSYKSGPLILQIFGWHNVLLGILVAALTASVSVRFFVKLLLRKGLSPFAWYRLALAGILWVA
jgi:undecaprenyl-diphosphatase